jgi:hypothetical protein
MANFIAISRSNYFHVTDEAKFMAAMDELGLEVYQGKQSEECTRLDDMFESENVFMVYPDDGDWPAFDDDDNDIDIVEILRKHLPPGEICVLHTIGYEKLRYLNHAIVALNASGVIKHESQENFYDELNRLGHKFTRADNC